MEQIYMQFEAGMKNMEDMVKASCSVMKPQMATTSSSSYPLGIHEMGNNGVTLFCFSNGELVDADINARYIGGRTNVGTVPNMIGFTAFREKIQQMLELPPSDMEFKIKCGVPCDESKLIAVDVDDDKSLQSIMERSNDIRAYILKNSPPSSPVVATERSFHPNFNAHHEGISLTTGTHDVNLQDRMPPSNVDAPPDSRDIDIFVGKEFQDVDALRNALSDAAIMTRRDYKPVKKTKSKLVMKCRDSSCDWRIRATRISNMPTFKVVKYQKVHTCLGHRGVDHPQATIRWIASKIWPSIQNNRDMEPKNIVKEMKNRFGIEISYNKASKAKNMALEGLREALLPRLIKELNEGGDVANFVLDKDDSFVYLFWAFSACIQALHKNLRPILFIYESHNEIGVTLSARGLDGNAIYGDAVHVAFALFSEGEVMAWDTFCRCLKEYVLSDNFLLCCSATFTVFSDYSEAASRAVQKYLPDVHHFFLGDGLENTVDIKYGSDVYREFELTREGETHSACEEHLQNIRRINEDAYDWLISLGLSHWVRVFYYSRPCFVDFGWFVDDFELPDGDIFEEELMLRPKAIVDLVEHSMKVVGSYFSDRRRVGNEITTKFTPKEESRIKWAKLDLHRQLVEVESIAINSYWVLGPDAELYVVDLEKRSCTCCDFQAQEHFCEHVLWVIIHECLDLTEYLPPWYTAETYRATYAGKIPRISDALEWKPATGRGRFLPRAKRGAGRPRKNINLDGL